MRAGRILWQLALADVRERVRRYSFLVTLAAAVYLGYATITDIVRMDLGEVRGVFNSAWSGMAVALSTTLFVSIVGFYIVKSAIERDRETGVGQILATTPVSRPLYLLGKWLSNFAVLGAIVAVMAAVAVVLQLWREEVREVELWPLLSPLLLLTLPALALVAALAVMFETVRGLRGGLGNVVYFFLWGIALVVPVKTHLAATDWTGLKTVISALQAAAAASVPGYKAGFSLNAGPRRPDSLQTFVWEGMDWTAELVAMRLMWVVVAAGLVIVAAAWFDRFDPARAARPDTLRHRLRRSEAAVNSVLAEPTFAPASRSSHAHLSALSARAGKSQFGGVLRAEILLMMKGRRWWWYAVAGGLLLASLLAPLEIARGKLLAMAWLWPVLVWSEMGTRESHFATGQIVFSCAHTARRQLPAVWLAGVLLGVMTGAGAGLRLLLNGDLAGVGAWLVGAMFIPALAFALGVWSGASKTFEAVYTVLWYIGLMQPTPGLDFIGASTQNVRAGYPLLYLGATVALLALAVVGRRSATRRGER